MWAISPALCIAQGQLWLLEISSCSGVYMVGLLVQGRLKAQGCNCQPSLRLAVPLLLMCHATCAGPSRFVPLFGMRQYKPELERPAVSFDQQVRPPKGVRCGPLQAVCMLQCAERCDSYWGRSGTGCLGRRESTRGLV